MCSEYTQFVERAKRKASQSICKFYVAALGFNKSGICVMTRTNRPRFSRYGGGLHAEQLIMREAKAKGIVKILICRVGRSGELRPIKPCDTCQKIADKLGIEIVSIQE
jgi:cytidine deaminase